MYVQLTSCVYVEVKNEGKWAILWACWSWTWKTLFLQKKSITVSETLSWVDKSTLSWRRSLSYRNQTIDLLCKSVETGVYKIGTSVMKELIGKLSISRELFFSETFFLRNLVRMRENAGNMRTRITPIRETFYALSKSFC